jgi:hypothetical protein
MIVELPRPFSLTSWIRPLASLPAGVLAVASSSHLSPAIVPFVNFMSVRSNVDFIPLNHSDAMALFRFSATPNSDVISGTIGSGAVAFLVAATSLR